MVKEFIQKMRLLKACQGSIEWAEQYDSKIDAWKACQNPEWMNWLLERLSPKSSLKKLACRFVRETPIGDGRLVWELLTDKRSRRAVEMAERYAQIPTGEMTDAIHDAWVVACEFSIHDTNVDYRAHAEACSAACSAAWGYAGSAARATARAASWIIDGTANNTNAWKRQCDIIREMFPEPIL